MPSRQRIAFSVEARYPHQVWELEVALPGPRVQTDSDLASLSSNFHRQHRDVFAIADETRRSNSRAGTPAPDADSRPAVLARVKSGSRIRRTTTRKIHLPTDGAVDAEVRRVDAMPIDATLSRAGDRADADDDRPDRPGRAFRLLPSGTLRIHPNPDELVRPEFRRRLTRSAN